MANKILVLKNELGVLSPLNLVAIYLIVDRIIITYTYTDVNFLIKVYF